MNNEARPGWTKVKYDVGSVSISQSDNIVFCKNGKTYYFGKQYWTNCEGGEPFIWVKDEIAKQNNFPEYKEGNNLTVVPYSTLLIRQRKIETMQKGFEISMNHESTIFEFKPLEKQGFTIRIACLDKTSIETACIAAHAQLIKSIADKTNG